MKLSKSAKTYLCLASVTISALLTVACGGSDAEEPQLQTLARLISAEEVDCKIVNAPTLTQINQPLMKAGVEVLAQSCRSHGLFVAQTCNGLKPLYLHVVSVPANQAQVAATAGYQQKDEFTAQQGITACPAP